MKKVFYFGLLLVFAASLAAGCKSNDGPYNPYLNLVKDKPSRKLAKANARHEKRTNKASKKLLKKRSKKYGS
jgi:hypothetical protein